MLFSKLRGHVFFLICEAIMFSMLRGQVSCVWMAAARVDALPFIKSRRAFSSCMGKI